MYTKYLAGIGGCENLVVPETQHPNIRKGFQDVLYLQGDWSVQGPECASWSLETNYETFTIAVYSLIVSGIAKLLTDQTLLYCEPLFPTCL